uniref:Ubiquitin conjugating enzyme E2 E2 n=2 Tax=Canis lupus familiaris TaxID=9615 RepID=A0A8C0N255_CANLF
MVLGKLDSHVQKNETRPFSYTIHKDKLKMDERSKCETRIHQNPRGTFQDSGAAIAEWRAAALGGRTGTAAGGGSSAEGSNMSTEAQRVDDSPSTSGGSSDGDQRESVQQEPEREQVQPKKKEGKISSKTAAKLTSAKRIQKELAEITLDPPPNCRLPSEQESITVILTARMSSVWIS